MDRNNIQLTEDVYSIMKECGIIASCTQIKGERKSIVMAVSSISSYTIGLLWDKHISCTIFACIGSPFCLDFPCVEVWLTLLTDKQG